MASRLYINVGHGACIFAFLVLSSLADGIENMSVRPMVNGTEQIPTFYHSSDTLRRFVAELAAPGPGHCDGLRLTRSLYALERAPDENDVPIKELRGKDAWTYRAGPGEGVIDTVIISRLKRSTANPPLRYALFFGEHGRELISSELGMYLLKAFCGHDGVDPVLRQRADNLLAYTEILLLPNIGERVRKIVENGHRCQREDAEHVDLNRNWDYKWSSDEGNPGPRPFSEPETQVARKQLEAFKPDVFLGTHSGDRAFWLPGAADYDDSAVKRQKASTWNTLLDISAHVNKHTKCDCLIGAPGKVKHLKHPGTSLDYAGLAMNIPYTMVWEVRLEEGDHCLPHFNPMNYQVYSRVLERWSLAMVYFAENAAAAMQGFAPISVSETPRVLFDQSLHLAKPHVHQPRHNLRDTKRERKPTQSVTLGHLEMNGHGGIWNSAGIKSKYLLAEGIIGLAVLLLLVFACSCVAYAAAYREASSRSMCLVFMPGSKA